MDKEIIKQYLGKFIKVLLKNRYKFSGKLLKVNENSITLDDWKDGKTELDIASIGSISENGKK